MTLDKILGSLFPNGHEVTRNHGLLFGQGEFPGGSSIVVIGVEGRTAIGIDEAIRLSGMVLDIVKRGRKDPILVLIDSGSQRMSKRDELLGLNEFLAHLAKCLILAEALGCRTIGLLYGHTAAGAFIATAMATRTLVALPSAEPVVMDLPSMARVTKLPIEVLEERAKSTPIFAPGLDNVAQTGAIAAILDPNILLATQVIALLEKPVARADTRDELGKERHGRPKAAEIAERVYGLVHGNQ
jgi:malonate decarboxylase gamma subunit